MRTVLLNGRRCLKGDSLIPFTCLIEDGMIVSIDKPVAFREGDEIIDLKGALVTAGLVDLHVHLREPGYTHKETIATGTAAAARGGYTTICAMPNTKPVPDTAEKLDAFYAKARTDARVKVLSYAPITQDLTSTELTDQALLKAHGAVAFTNDGVGVQDAKTMSLALKQARNTHAIIAAHAEDDSLKGQGVVHEGTFSTRFGLPGIPASAEAVQVARDLLLAEEAQARYHVCHVSTKESVRAIREAKRAKIRVSAEVAPHHLLLTELDIPADDANYKMNPPLRSAADRQALVSGLLDGTLDCIATDHAPHTPEEKAQGMLKAPFGIIGLEFAFALLYTTYVLDKTFTLAQLIGWMSEAPARCFNLEAGTLEIGGAADIACFDLDTEVTIGPDFVSKAKNSPFIARRVKGDCILTLVGGKTVWRKA